jgi:hypothetical protein
MRGETRTKIVRRFKMARSTNQIAKYNHLSHSQAWTTTVQPTGDFYIRKGEGNTFLIFRTGVKFTLCRTRRMEGKHFPAHTGWINYSPINIIIKLFECLKLSGHFVCWFEHICGRNRNKHLCFASIRILHVHPTFPSFRILSIIIPAHIYLAFGSTNVKHEAGLKSVDNEYES